MKMKFGITALAMSATLALAACGGGNSSDGAANGGGAASGETQSVTIGALPIVPTAVIHMGVEKGIFEDNNLDVKIETGQGGAALVPAIMSGTMNFATGNPTSLLTARDRGMDVRVIASYTYDTPDGVHAVLAKADSGIESAKDLEGKTVAINTLKSMGDLHIMDAVEKDGGDPSKVEFVEMGFPSMEAALAGGQVDAVWTPEPFMTIIQEAGYNIVTYPGVESVEGHPTMMFFTSGKQVEEQPEMAENMKKAINEAMDYAQENPDELREVASKEFDIDPALVEKLVLEDVGGPVRTDTVEATGELMKKFGFIEKDADVEGLLEFAEGE